MSDARTAVPRLRMAGVHKRFGATVALAGVDLEVHAGEVLALVGENGAGKSTLMKVLAGVHRPEAGQLWLDGEPFAPRTPQAARRQGVAMIYQELSLAPHLTVEANILLGMEPLRGGLLDRPRARRMAAEALRQLGRPDIPLEIPVAQLPIAERQLVEIGRAVAIGCRVLVLDEPTSSLTSADIQQLFALVRRLRAQGHAIIYISHVMEEVQAISDRYTVLRDGQTVGSGRTAEATAAQIVAQMVGRDLQELYPRRHHPRGAAILEVQALAGRDGSRLQEASFTLHRGEVLGIAGLVGAGRTELLRALFGLDPVRSGHVRLGAYTGAATPAQRWAQGMGMVSEDRKSEGLALNRSVADNLALTSLPWWVSPAWLAADTADWVARLSIRCQSPWQPIGALSGGNQQKVALARLLHHDVDVLLLDEPTRGIDVGAKAQIYAHIDALACAGKAVLMVSSYLPELLGVCDRIAVMRKGRLGAPQEVAATDEHRIMMEAT
jgi:ribose transport system ATP-binding protein